MIKKLNDRKFVLKIFSFFFSIFIWVYVISTAEVEMDKQVDIRLTYSDKYALVDEVTDTFQMTLKGPRVLVKKFVEEASNLNLEIKPKGNRARYTKIFKLNQYMRKLPLGIKLLSFSPKKLTIKLETKVEKALPINLNLGDIVSAPWFKKEKLEVTPKTILVSGAKSVMKGIKSLITKKVNRNDLISGKPIKVAFNLPQGALALKQDFAVVSYSSVGTLSEFTFSKIPIIFQSAKIIKSVYPRTVELKLKGDKTQLANFNTELIQVIAPIQKSTKGNAKVELFVELPEGIELIQIEPKFVDVIMEN
jgi:YbbR domain-containing protein